MHCDVRRSQKGSTIQTVINNALIAMSLQILTPRETPTGWVFDVTGSIGLFTGGDDVMLTKSLQRIGQHYTLPHIQIAAVLDPSLPLAA